MSELCADAALRVQREKAPRQPGEVRLLIRSHLLRGPITLGLPTMAIRGLLIDDDERLFELLASFLEQHGVDLAHARDGHRGLQELAAGAYDVVLLDVMMPGIDGLDVLRRIRKETAVPVIMLTAKGDEADRVVGLELGADDYIAKPFSPARAPGAAPRRASPNAARGGERAAQRRRHRRRRGGARGAGRGKDDRAHRARVRHPGCAVAPRGPGGAARRAPDRSRARRRHRQRAHGRRAHLAASEESSAKIHGCREFAPCAAWATCCRGTGS